MIRQIRTGYEEFFEKEMEIKMSRKRKGVSKKNPCGGLVDRYGRNDNSCNEHHRRC